MTSESKQKLAIKRIGVLFAQAELQFKMHPALSKRYMRLARTMAMRYRVRFTKDQKRSYCKKCYAYLHQGVNSTIRLSSGKIILTCKECGFVRRWIYVKPKVNRVTSKTTAK